MYFRLTAPLAGFRPYESRDYQESFPLPPHSTVFGCLLAVLGVERHEAHAFAGTRLGVGGRTGERSTVLRKMRRDPANPPKDKPRLPAFRPEYQEILSDVVVWAFVARGEAERDLAAELKRALEAPELIERHGLVSLGESCFMLDTITATEAPDSDLLVLRPDPKGAHSLTLWVDFGDRGKTTHGRFELVQAPLRADDAVTLGHRT